MNEMQNFIIVKGAKENNLKNIDLKIPKNQLVVFTGVSGSGKSSLAFNTIYEEGRRRYVDSLSSYARQFLGNTQKPLVDSIEGLSPAISIEQKTTHNNPRSTVGTITEIYDYLRLLYARLGQAYCPNHKKEISAQKSKDIINKIFKNQKGSKIIVSSPIVKQEKGMHANLFEKLKKDGFLRVNVNGQIFSLEDEIALNKNKRHDIEIIVDRIILEDEERTRISEAIELAIEYGKGLVSVEILDKKEKETFSKFHSCSHGDFNMPLLEPRLFSFNSPAGMCKSCKGLGLKLSVDTKKLIPNDNKSINQGGITFYKNIVGSDNLDWQEMDALLNYYKINKDLPIKKLKSKELKLILRGSADIIDYKLVSASGIKREKQDYIEGVADKIERRHLSSSSELIRNWYRNNFMSDIKCETCNGKRLNEFALAVKINDKDISEFTSLSIEEAHDQILEVAVKDKLNISEIIINELSSRLSFLVNVGLDYLTLERKAETLSGGESQRIRLATQIGSNLTGVLYVLDEPSIGLHQKDNSKLIKTLKKMVDIGNTLIVVEHDIDTIKSADYVVDIGKKAGDEGGNIVFSGSPKELVNAKNSITGDFLANRKMIEKPKSRRSGNGKVLEVIGAKENNLQNVNAKFPLGKFISVTGVSGSGKSTLVKEVLAKAIQNKILNPFLVPGKHEKLKGIENVDKLILVDQSPIGRTPRSNPATYTSVFNDIRDVFTNTQLAKARGYKKGRFSFNVDGGRCDKCYGDGVIKIEMHFLPDVYVECNHCEGKRYNLETLEVKYKAKSIYDVLEMRVSEAIDFFGTNKKIQLKIKSLVDVGLGYIKLGQSATTLSGGEAQRVKLATFLQKKPTGKTIYILDEPTTGLHQYDVKKLISVLNRIVDGGDTVLVVEHNLDIIKVADYIIDLGPGGGVKGGKIVAQGTPEQIVKIPGSFTGEFLKKLI